MTDERKPRPRDAILQAIIDLNEHCQLTSRKRIAEVTGLKMTIVDDTLTRLRETGVVRLAGHAHYEAVDQTPDRPVSTTSLPHGRMKLEIGDDVIADLTPREALALAKQLAGLLLAFGAYSWALVPPAPGGKQG
ncbi:MAG: hypothetical protein Q8S02_12415 [Hydrogenophaga sp.]|nr:hypothetical protein [Hydrogenophaga sp.]